MACGDTARKRDSNRHEDDVVSKTARSGPPRAAGERLSTDTGMSCPRNVTRGMGNVTRGGCVFACNIYKETV